MYLCYACEKEVNERFINFKGKNFCSAKCANQLLTTRRRERFIWKHSQRLKRWSKRGWIHIGKWEIGWEYHFNIFNNKCGIHLNTHWNDDLISFYIGIPFIGSFYLSIDKHGWWTEKINYLDISIHDGGIWWHFWDKKPDEWSKKKSRLRQGNWNIIDWIFGRGEWKESEKVIEEREVVVPMPEKSYKSIGKITESIYTRKRVPGWLFSRKIRNVEIKVEEGIPIEGKGENSWDCGEDAIYSLYCGADSIEEGIGKMVTSVMESRKRYGTPKSILKDDSNQEE